MSPRELVILSLGLAIVAVVLRGLYVAIRGRRGQLRLAIDKNIPRDVDLDALELSELPSGGARVVGRSLDEVNRQNTVLGKARARAAGISLGDTTLDDAAIPVLMDPVQLRSMMPAAEPVQTPDSAELVADIDSEVDYEDPDDVLLDYQARERDGHLRRPDDDADELNQEDDDDFDSTQQRRRAAGIDTMSQVAPDYPDDDDLEEDSYDDDVEEYEDDAEANSEADIEDVDDDFDDELDADDASAEEDVDDDYYSESLDEAEADEDNDDTDVSEYIDIDDDDLDDFSMTAGERIGFNKTLPPAAKQSNLFQDLEHDMEPAPKQHSTFKPKLSPEPKSKSKAKRKSLFGSFSRKNPDEENVRKPIAESPPKQARVEPEKLEETQKQKPVETVAQPAPRPAEPRVSSEPSEVIVINVMAKPGRVFVGDDLLHTLITSGLKFGDMNIFHRRLAGENKGPVLFSVANMVNPGVFDLNKMDEFTTLGVSLFLALPTPINNLEAFKQMLQVAQQLCSAMDGDLRDDNRNLMTSQTTEHYRQRIRDFELRRLKAVGARG